MTRPTEMPLFDEVEKYFIEKSEVDFAYLFGSRARGGAFPFSDLDVAIHLTEAMALPALGQVVSELETLTTVDVDIVVLNDMYLRDPVFAFEVVSQGVLLFCRDRQTWVRYKHLVYLHYLDVLPMRQLDDRLFLERLKRGEFARAGAAEAP